MTRLKDMVIVTCLLCVSLSVCYLLMQVSDLVVSTRVVIEQAPLIAQTSLHAEMSYLRADLKQEIRATRTDLLIEVGNWREVTSAQIDQLRKETVHEVSLTRQSLDNQLTKANDSVEYIAGLRTDLQPTIQTVNELSPSMMRNTLGLLAATKVTMGETAQAAKKIDAALPEFLEAAQKSADNSTKTTEATVKTMNNVERLTRPIPRYVSIPLSIGAKVSQIMVPWLAF